MKYFDVENSLCSKSNLLILSELYDLKIRSDIEYFTPVIHGVSIECVNMNNPFYVGEIGVKSSALLSHYAGPYIHVDDLSYFNIEFINGKFVTRFRLEDCKSENFVEWLKTTKDKLSKIFIF